MARAAARARVPRLGARASPPARSSSASARSRPLGRAAARVPRGARPRRPGLAPRRDRPRSARAVEAGSSDATSARLAILPPFAARGASLGGSPRSARSPRSRSRPASVASDADAASTCRPGGSLTDGFLSAFLLIFFSEIGDKTFFIAVLLATQQSKSSVFAGTFGALAVMTLISVGIGQVFHVAEENLSVFTSDVPWDDYLAVALLLVFGVQTILGAEEETAEEEEEDAKVAVAGMQFDGQTALILSTFALVFAAEWGDKSFIATIALSAAASPLGVVLGATAGHGVATGIAVLVGDILGDVISERVVKYTGGALFILFAIATALDIPQN